MDSDSIARYNIQRQTAERFQKIKDSNVLMSDPKPERVESYRPIIALLGVCYNISG